jgi:murein DD-endopeptidase MepM/ murein hydrolase activator NlpD
MLRSFSARILALAVVWSPPVAGPVVERFDPPAKAWSSGHRGIDFAVATGSPVRAVAAGTVTYAGVVAGSQVVTISHPGGLRSSYSFLSRLSVKTGDRVTDGLVLGLSGGTGPGHGPGVVHLSARRGPRYLDPLPWLDKVAAVHLVPVGGPAPPPCPTLAPNPAPAGNLHARTPSVAPPGRPAGGS